MAPDEPTGFGVAAAHGGPLGVARPAALRSCGGPRRITPARVLHRDALRDSHGRTDGPDEQRLQRPQAPQHKAGREPRLAADDGAALRSMGAFRDARARGPSPPRPAA
jgi:hypothetical protein